MKLFNFFKAKKLPEATVETKEIASGIKAGLALGSGGTKGFAHIGVLKAFEDEGIRFDYVAGTSAGSIVGALYSFGFSSNDILEKTANITIKDVKNGTLIFMPSSAKPIEEVLNEIMGDVTFEQSMVPFACIATDLVKAEEVVFKSGSIARAVSASCAVPPFYRPVVWGEMHLIDGAFVNPIPAKTVRDMGADIVISVEVNSSRGVGTESLGIIDVYRAATRIATRLTAESGFKNSDIVIKPDMDSFTSYNMKGANEMIKRGYEETYAHMESIKRLLKIPNPSIMHKQGVPEIQFNPQKKKKKSAINAIEAK